ncbi:Hypothetical protein MVR_LOCUS130 [uncultured virus]|nr:Hypothetical protein MVR_LOCUS130 [uncultured virus]
MIGEARGVIRENRGTIDDAAAWIGSFVERIEGHVNSAVRYRMVRTEATGVAEQIGNMVAMCVDKYAENKAARQQRDNQFFNGLGKGPVRAVPMAGVSTCPYARMGGHNITNCSRCPFNNQPMVRPLSAEPTTYLPVHTPLPRARPTLFPSPAPAPAARDTWTCAQTPLQSKPLPIFTPARMTNIQGPSIWTRAANWGRQTINQVNVPALLTAYTTYMENMSKDPVQLLVNNLFQNANLAQTMVNEQKAQAVPQAAPCFMTAFRTETKPTEQCIRETKIDAACDEVKSMFRAKGLEDPSLGRMIDCISGKIATVDFFGDNMIGSIVDIANSVAEELRSEMESNPESFQKTISTISEVFKETLNDSGNSNDFPEELRALFDQLPTSQSPAPEEIQQEEPMTPDCESAPETRCDSPMPEFLFNALKDQVSHMDYGNIFASMFGLPFTPMMGEMESSESSNSSESCDSESDSDDSTTGDYSVCSMDADITDCSIDERVDSPELD